MAIKTLIREAKRSDITALKNNLREADREEILAAGHSSSEEALTQSYERSSICFCLDIDDHPAALFGIVPDSLCGDSAIVWLLGTSEINKAKKSFVKLSRKMIAEFLLQYPRLWNIVDGRYVKAIRWLQSCGAVFANKPLMMSGVPFYGFNIRRKL